jgi:phage baseplate assembly protein W
MARNLAYPFRFVNGRAVTVERDSSAEIQGNVEAILRTPLGARIEVPDYGIPDMAFKTGGPVAEPIREAIERHEPRARFNAYADGSDLDTMIGRVQVTMQEAETAGG